MLTRLAPHLTRPFYRRFTSSSKKRSIGLNDFQKRTKQGNSYYELWPSHLDSGLWGEMCSFFKAVDFDHPPQSNLLTLPNNPVSPTHQNILSVHYRQAEHAIVSKKPELQRTTSLIDNIIKVAYFELQTEFLSTPLFSVISSSYQSVLREYANQLESLFFITGMIDLGYSALVPFPTMTLSDFSQISQDQQNKLTGNLNRLNSLFERGEFPILLDDKGYPIESYREVPKLPKSLSAFKSSTIDPAPFPFLDIIIDNKATGRDLNSVQMLAYLYAQLATQARYRGIDEPSVAVGIVTNGYEWTFTIFQLNTLDLNHTQTGPRNAVWRWTEKMSLSGPKCDLTPYFTLKNILSVAIRSSLNLK